MQSTKGGDQPRLIKVPPNHTWNKTFLQEAEALIAHDEGTNVLHVASCVDNTGTIDVLLKYGAKVDTPTMLGRTALHCSAYSGFAEIVRMLLDHGANYNLRLLDGRTPLHDAALMGHTDSCIALLEAGADPYIQSYHNFLSPIDIAATPELTRILTTVGPKNKWNRRKHAVWLASSHNSDSENIFRKLPAEVMKTVVSFL